MAATMAAAAATTAAAAEIQSAPRPYGCGASFGHRVLTLRQISVK